MGVGFLESFLFPAPELTPSTHRKIPLVRLDGNIPALWIEREGNEFTLLYLHGNAVDLGSIYFEMRELHLALECNILAPEYPGYGLRRNDDEPCSIVGVTNTARIAMKWLGSRVRLSGVIVFGRSIGTGPAAEVATSANGRVGGLILQSPFRSIQRLVKDIVKAKTFSALGWLGNLMPNGWDTESAIARWRGPLLIIHGMNDEVIPFSHGKAIYETAAGNTLRHGTLQAHFPQDSPHNAYSVRNDLVCPISLFLGSLRLQKQQTLSSPVIPLRSTLASPYIQPAKVSFPPRDRAPPSRRCSS